MDITIGIVVVDYHSVLQTIKYVKEQLRVCRQSHKIVIVLNDVYEEELSLLQKELKCQVVNKGVKVDLEENIYVLPFSENLGYAKGNNKGVNFLKENFNSQYICICNNDLNFNGVDPFEPLTNKLKDLTDVGGIGPRILGLDNRDQNPHKYISITEKYLYRNLLVPVMNLYSKTTRYNTIVENAPEGHYYRLMGCFMIFKTSAFIDCGMFDENTFLFGEEAILAERLKNIGKSCYYYPSVTIIHEHGKTISKFFKRRKRLIQEFITDKYYYQTYRNVNAMEAFLSELFLHVSLTLNYIKGAFKNK